MRALIRRKHEVWVARFGDKIEYFFTFEAAAHWVEKASKRWYKESVAYSIVEALNAALLNCKESELYNKLKKNKCKGITKAQYGYLRGIHERQLREW